MSEDQETPKVEDAAAKAPAAQDAPKPEPAPKQAEQAGQAPDAPPAAEAADKAGAEEKAPKPTSRTAPPLPAGEHYIWGTGRRKSAVARVRIRPGSGNFLVNKRPIEEFFCKLQDRQAASAPLETVEMVTSWDIWVNVRGGGTTGQAGAVKMGLARAIVKAVPELEQDLRKKGLLTRDARMVERKKYGQPGARKRFQFYKR